MFWISVCFNFLFFYLFLNNFFISGFLTVLIYGVILYFTYKQEKQHIHFLNIALILGCLFGIGYASYIDNKYDIITNKAILKKKYQAKVLKVTPKTATITFSKHHKPYKLRLLYKNITLNINDIITFKCSNVIFRNNSLLEELNKIHYTCKAKIQIVKKRDITLLTKLKSYLYTKLNTFNRDSLSKGFLIADTANFHPVELEIFRKMGIAHLFSTSGLHLGLLYGVIFLFFSLLRMPTLGKILGYLLCTVFLLILDFRTSFLRAHIFLSIYLFLNLFGRKTSIYQILFAASCFSEWINPLSTFSISFILSFGVTSSILLTFKLWKKIIPLKTEWLKNNLALTLSAFTGSLYLSLFFFNYINVLSIVYNFILVPFASVYVTLLVFSFFVPFLNIFVEYADIIIRFFAKIHYYIWESHFPSINLYFTWFWVFLISIFLIYTSYFYLKKKYLYIKKYAFNIFLFLLALFFLQFFIFSTPSVGFKFFHSGLMIYDKPKIIVLGSVPAFINDAVVFKRPNMAIQEVYVENKLLTPIKKYLLGPYDKLHHEPKLTNKHTSLQYISQGFLSYKKKYCFIVAHQMKPSYYSKSTFSSCHSIYLAQSTKLKVTQKEWEDFFQLFGFNKPIRIVSYNKWLFL